MNQRPKTIREIEKISDPGLHNIGGVPGLYLRVTESGRYYIFRYVENGKRSALSLGNAKRVTLAEARKMALRYRIALDAGKSIRRIRKTAEPQSVTSVNRLAEKWLKSKEAAGYWKENKRGSRDVRLRLSNYILPNFGDREIASISAKEIADAFKEPISEHKGRILQVIGNLREIFNWAIAMGLIPPMMNPADMRGPLGVLLAPWLRYAKPRDNLGALPFREIPSFIEELFN